MAEHLKSYRELSCRRGTCLSKQFFEFLDFWIQSSQEDTIHGNIYRCWL